MTIRTTDNKGRIHINEKGKAYKVWENDEGVITMHPIEIPEVPKFEKNTMPGIYVRPSGRMSTPDIIVLYTTFGSGAGGVVGMGKKVAEMAKEHKVPVVVEAVGLGAALADVVKDEGVETISLYPG